MDNGSDCKHASRERKTPKEKSQSHGKNHYHDYWQYSWKKYICKILSF